jgi:hypothetical protein
VCLTKAIEFLSPQPIKGWDDTGNVFITRVCLFHPSPPKGLKQFNLFEGDERWVVLSGRDIRCPLSGKTADDNSVVF